MSALRSESLAEAKRLWLDGLSAVAIVKITGLKLSEVYAQIRHWRAAGLRGQMDVFLPRPGDCSQAVEQKSWFKRKFLAVPLWRYVAHCPLPSPLTKTLKKSQDQLQCE